MASDYSLEFKEYIEPEFGSVSPLAPSPMIENQDGMGFGEALFKGALPYRMARRIGQGFFYEKEEGYNPFERWKNSNLPDQFLSSFMNTNSNEEADNLMFRIGEDAERQRVISEAGFKGEAADFLASVALDPTTYFGFGAGMMLKSGLKTSVAFGVSGGLAGGTYAALDAIASPEQASAVKTAAIIGGATVMGGLLGHGVDTYAKLKSKNIVKKSFDEMSHDALTSAHNIAVGEPQSVGAMVNPDMELFDGGVTGNELTKALARSTRLVGSKQWGQTAQLKTTRDAFTKVFGVNLRTESGAGGKATPIFSVVEETDKIRDQAINTIKQEFGDTKIISLLKGKKYERSDAQEALRRLWAGESSDGLTPLQEHIYNFNKKYYGDFSKTMLEENVPHYNSRKNYGAPVLFSSERVLGNIDEARKIVETDMLERRAFATKKIDEINFQIDEIKLKIDQFSNDKPFVNFSIKKIESLEEEIDILSRLKNASDEEIATDAAIATNDMAGGLFEFKEFFDAQKMPNKSKFFNHRFIDPLKYIDFLEVDPVELARRYVDSTAPHIGFNRAFPQYKDMKELIADFTQKAKEEALKADNIEKAMSEISDATSRLERAWRDETGITHAEKIQELGVMAPYIAATNKAMYTTQMGGQTLAAIQEPIAISMFHGIGGVLGLLGTIKTSIVNKEFREMSRKSINYAGLGLEDAKNIILQNRIGFEISQRELGNKISQVSEKSALWMARSNLSIYWDKFFRTAMASAQEGILKEDILKWGTLKKSLKDDLIFLGIDDKNIIRVQNQLKKHGVDIEGRFVSNVQNWDDKLARETWVNVLRRDNKRTSISPQTGDTPYMFRTPLGQLFFKYKSWGVTATQKYMLYGMQNPAQTGGGVVSLIGMSALVQTLLDASKGKEIDTSPEEILYGAINRSGVLGVLPEAGGSYLMNRLFDIQSGGGRVYEYQDMQGILAGPTGEFLNDTGKVLSAAVPKYDEETGEYGMTFYDKNGNIKQGVVNSLIDIMPIPLAKPWLKEAAKEDED